MKTWATIGLILLVVFSMSGCIDLDDILPPPDAEIEYFDDAIKLETQIAKMALPGQRLVLSAWLTNQVENAVRDVDLKITDPYSLEIKDVKCTGGQKNDVDNPTGCHYDSIPSLTDRAIEFQLKVPNKQKMGSIDQTLNPKITLEYVYSGQSIFYFPALSQNKFKTDTEEELTQTHGPIKVDIERGYRADTKNDWEKEGAIISILVTIEDVIAKKDSDVTISDNHLEFSLTLKNLNADPEWGRCDFVIENGGRSLFLGSPIELPMENPFVCTLRVIEDDENKGGWQMDANKNPLPISKPEITARVEAHYNNYKYTLTKREKIKVETDVS